MKHPTAFLLSLWLMHAPASAQPKSSNPPHPPRSLFAGYSPVTLRLDDGSSFTSPRLDGLFNHFDVIDERPDTARIGIHTTGKSASIRTHQMTFPRSTARELASYMDHHFARPEAPYKALVVLRTLWLSDAVYQREELMKAPEKRFEKSRIRVKAEIYAVHDSVYMPLFRFDTLLVSRKGSYALYTKDLASLIDHMADSATVVMTAKRETGRLISRGDIEAFNHARFDMSISHDSLLHPGVYASYEEFRNNAPTIDNYEIRTEDNNLLVYIKEPAGKSWYNHSAFGYCDGKNVYIMKDGILRPAWREGKAWYFFGKTRMERHSPEEVSVDQVEVAARTIPYMNGVPISALAHTFIDAGNEISRIRVYALDMDNGSVF